MEWGHFTPEKRAMGSWILRNPTSSSSSAPPLTPIGCDLVKTVPHLPFNDFEAWAQNLRCGRGGGINCAPVRERCLERDFEAQELSIINRRVYESFLQLI
jgi:hypothetical protein